MNWGRGFFRLWIFATLYWVVMVAILLRPDALLNYPHAHSHEINKTSQRVDGQPKDSIPALIADKVQASLLGLTETEKQRDNVVVRLESDAPSRRFRDRLLKFAVVALIPPWDCCSSGSA